MTRALSLMGFLICAGAGAWWAAGLEGLRGREAPSADDGALVDTDGDGLTDQEENSLTYGDGRRTDPLRWDTDGDGVADGVERGRPLHWMRPSVAGKAERSEGPIALTDPTREDTDGDQVPDGEEDRNHNGRLDDGETDPRRVDSDGDGVADGAAEATPRGETAREEQASTEPLLHDFLGPIRSRRGYLEQNTLLSVTREGLRWSIETEYAVRSGTNLELELPVLGWKPHGLRLGVQQRAGDSWALVLVGQHGLAPQSPWRVGGLAVAGWSPWSGWGATLQGGWQLGAEATPGRPAPALVLAPGLFREGGGHLRLGVESALQVERRAVQAQLLPQLHLALPGRLRLQAGVGVHWSDEGGLSPLGALRLASDL